MASEPFERVEITEKLKEHSQCELSDGYREMVWRRIAREAVAQLRKTADEIEAALNG